MKKRIIFLLMLSFPLVSNRDLGGSENNERVKFPIPATGESGSIPLELANTIAQHFQGYRLITQSDLDGEMVKWVIEELHEIPSAWLQADFDGNGELDYAVMLRKVEEKKVIWLQVVLLKEKQKFVFIELCKSEYECVEKCKSEHGEVQLYYTLVPAGVKVEEFEGFVSDDNARRSALLTTPGIKVVYFERKSYIYFWDSKKKQFDCIQTED
jgi:hypothetical protein